MTPKEKPPLDPKIFVAKGARFTDYRKGQIVFSQGEPADAVFYIQNGNVKLTVVSKQGREAIIAILGPSEFIGETCLAPQPFRMATATAVIDSTLMRVEKQAMSRVLREEPEFSQLFIAHLLSRIIRMEGDLVDQLFNSSEKRLARVLLLLANFGKAGKPEPVIPKISQETLAEMIGTTRSRVCFFMNKFRKLGYIEHNDGLHIHTSLLNVVLHDQCPGRDAQHVAAGKLGHYPPQETGPYGRYGTGRIGLDESVPRGQQVNRSNTNLCG